MAKDISVFIKGARDISKVFEGVADKLEENPEKAPAAVSFILLSAIVVKGFAMDYDQTFGPKKEEVADASSKK